MKLVIFRALAKAHKITNQGIRAACVRYGIKWTLAPIVGPGRREVALTIQQAARFKAEWNKEHGR